MNKSGETPDLAVRPRRKLSRAKKWMLWIFGILVVGALVVAGVATYLFNRAEPTIRASLIQTLQSRFHSRVELDGLSFSVPDGFKVEAHGLRIWLPEAVQEQEAEAEGLTGEAAAQAKRHSEPWITVNHMWFRTSGRVLPGKPIVVAVIHVEGVRVVLPPKAQRPKLSLSGKDDKGKQPEPPPADTTVPATSSQPAPASGPSGSLFKIPPIEIKRIESKDAVLLIERKQEPGKNKPPLDFEFSRVVLTPDGRGGPVAFDVDMINARPVGKIHTTGHFGPWVAGDPHALPLDGDYSFDNADLGTIKGIQGILSSTGHYQGTLSQIECHGQTRTPDFRLERVKKGTGVLLTTTFHATVDGTNGDTWLKPVDAMLGRTHILAAGQVIRTDNPDGNGHGHDIILDVTIDRGRIDDILQIAADTDKPFMTGNLTLKTKYHQPPGKESIWDKLQLDGQFHLSEAQFTNDSMQDKIKQLSLRGQGKPGEVKKTDSSEIASEMQGHFTLGGGTLQLPDLDYQVPGAEIVAHGTYGLRDGAMNFEGDAKLDAALSQIVGGWKGFLLKPADRLLKKNGAGTDVPIHVKGTRKDPQFGVDFGRLGKTDRTPDQPSSPPADAAPRPQAKQP